MKRLPAFLTSAAVALFTLPLFAQSVVEVRSLPPYVTEHQLETPPMPVPENMPVPVEFQRIADELPIAQAFEVRTTAATLMRSFPALEDDNSSFPPDTNGAAGPQHVVTILNTQMRIQTRSGATLQTVSTQTFFNAVRQGGRAFDPHIVYDPRANRWLACAVSDQKSTSNPQRTGSALLFAVSRTSNPLDVWDLYRYDHTSNSESWLDYPMLGFDDSKVVISLNTHSMTDDKFVRAVVFVIDRASPAGSFTRIDHAVGSGGTLAPTISMDPGQRTFLVQRWNSNFQNAGYLRLYSVSSAGIAPISFPSSPSPWASSAGGGDFAPQLASTQKIDSGDDRIHSAVLRNGTIWATQAALYPAVNPSRMGINWWQLSTTGVVLARGTVEDTTGVHHYAYPSLAVNRRNEALIGCTRFSATTYASAMYVFLPSGGPVIYKFGEAPYYKIGSGTRNRWGDYSATVVDPINDSDFWTIQEYSAVPTATYDRWGTWWANVAPPAPPKRRSTRH